MCGITKIKELKLIFCLLIFLSACETKVDKFVIGGVNPESVISPVFTVDLNDHFSTDENSTWIWEPGNGSGTGTYRYKLDNDPSWSITREMKLTRTNLSLGPHTLVVQEQYGGYSWSDSSSYSITVWQHLRQGSLLCGPTSVEMILSYFGVEDVTTKSGIMIINDDPGSGGKAVGQYICDYLPGWDTEQSHCRIDEFSSLTCLVPSSDPSVCNPGTRDCAYYTERDSIDFYTCNLKGKTACENCEKGVYHPQNSSEHYSCDGTWQLGLRKYADEVLGWESVSKGPSFDPETKIVDEDRFNLVKFYLQNNAPIIFFVKFHYMVAVGVDEEKEIVYILNPSDSDRKLHPISFEDFVKYKEVSYSGCNGFTSSGHCWNGRFLAICSGTCPVPPLTLSGKGATEETINPDSLPQFE